VQLANLMVTRVRQRLIQEHEQRRGRKIDPAWAHGRCCSAAMTPSPTKAGIGWPGCSPSTIPPMSCQRPGCQGTAAPAPDRTNVDAARTEKMRTGRRLIFAFGSSLVMAFLNAADGSIATTSIGSARPWLPCGPAAEDLAAVGVDDRCHPRLDPPPTTGLVT
jgi:hypothetical protein